MGRIVILFITVCALFFLSVFCVRDEKAKEAETEEIVEVQRCASKAEECTKIVLTDGGKSEISGGGAEASFAGVSIAGKGRYEISGTLKDGQICVAAEDAPELVFDNVKVHSRKGAALTVTGGGAKIVLTEGSVNRLSDACEYGAGEFTAACVSAENSLVIEGEGSLFVSGNYADGIACGEELRIEGGSVNVSAVRNALKGENIVLAGGNVVFM